MLVLIQPVVGVGNLEPVAGGEQVQVEGVVRAGLVVQAIEDRLVVARARKIRRFVCLAFL